MQQMNCEITIISARNIMAGDINGKSDGYVIMETKSSPQVKTKVYKPSLNPEWNEKFSVRLQPEEMIKFSVFDKDTFGKDDALGDCYFTVPKMMTGEVLYEVLPISKKGFLNICVHCLAGNPPNSLLTGFSDQKPEILLFDFQTITQFKKNDDGEGRILIKVDGKDDMTTERFQFRRKTKVYQKVYVKANVGSKITLELQEKDIIGKFKTVDQSSLIVPDYKAGQVIDERLPAKKGATIITKITCLRSVYHNVAPQFIPFDNEPIQANEIKFSIFVEKAVDLKGADFNGRSDPYFKFKTSGSKEKQSYFIVRTIKPEWEQAYRVKGCLGEELKIDVFDWNRIGKHTPLGSARTQIQMYSDNIWKTEQIRLDGKGSIIVYFKRVKMPSPGFQRLKEGGPANLQPMRYPPQGMPPQPMYGSMQGSMPPPGYPPHPAYPPQPVYGSMQGSMPPPGYPPAGYPPAGYPPQGMPPAAMPPRPMYGSMQGSMPSQPVYGTIQGSASQIVPPQQVYGTVQGSSSQIVPPQGQ